MMKSCNFETKAHEENIDSKDHSRILVVKKNLNSTPERKIRDLIFPARKFNICITLRYYFTSRIKRCIGIVPNAREYFILSK